MSITDLEREQIAIADRLAQRKANTLGVDYSVSEEPYLASSMVLRDDIFSETPSTSSNFASPNYGDIDLGGGSVATRYVKIRLHPVVTSGIDSSKNIQTFMAVHSPPKSDDPVDIERVRIKHLVPPELSLGRGHAGEVDPTLRGFEIALYPAMDDGAELDAYDSYGAIPVSADPTAIDGMGDDARWTVDYANGIVRFSGAPISGTGSVFNPFNHFGNILGITDNTSGRFTLFATFYQYTGPNLTTGADSSVVTVGDGADSYGSYYGSTSSVMQSAVDSLAPLGGTVYLKEGNYAYTGTVHVPANVNVVGLSHRAEIKKPGNLPAFRMFGDNSSISGLSIFGNITGGVSRGAISVNVDNVNEELSNVRIENNFFWVGDSNEPAIEIAPLAAGDSHNTFRGLRIENNTFRPYQTVARLTYITEFGTVGNVSFGDARFVGNDFGANEAYAINFGGAVTEKFESIVIADSYMASSVDIRIDTGYPIEQLSLRNNTEFGSLDLYGLNEAVIFGNTGGPITIGDGGAENCTLNDNIFGDISVDGYVIDSKINNNVANRLDVLYKANNLSVQGNTFYGPASLACDSADGSWNIANVTIIENHFLDSLHISNDLAAAGAHEVRGLKLLQNICDMGITFGARGDAGASISMNYTDVLVQGNTLAENVNADYAILLAEESTDPTPNRATSTFTGLRILDNTLFADVRHPDHLNGDIIDKFEFSGNIEIEDDVGLFLEPADIQDIKISNNRVTYVKLFEFAHTLASPQTCSQIVIKDNLLRGGDGTIVLSPNISTGANYLELIGLVITGNTFDSTGYINILGGGTEDYRLSGSTISNNTLPYYGSYLGVFGVDDLGGSSAITRLDVKDNNINGTIFIGGADAVKIQINNNSAHTAIHLKKALTELTFVGNSTLFTGFNGNVTAGVINDNQMSEGMELDSNFIDVTMADNSIDGYVIFHSAFTDSTLSGCAIGGDLTFGISTRSSFVGNTIFGDMSVGSMVDSTISDNVVASLAIVGTVDTSSISSNTSQGVLTFGSSLTSSTVNGNVYESTLVTGNTSNSIISGNVGITAGTTSVVYFNGTITDSTITSNAWESPSATVDIAFGNMTGSIFSNNRVLTGSSRTIDFGSLTESNINNCVFDTSGLGSMSTDLMSDSIIKNCYVDSPSFTLTTSGVAMTDSTIDSCDFTGTFDIASIGTASAIVNSSIANNIFSGVVTVNCTVTTSAGVFSGSGFNNNRSSSNVIIEAGNTAVSAKALLNSTVSGNIIGGNLDIDYDATSATPTTLISNSVIDGNNITGSMLIAASMTTVASPANIVDNTSISNNIVGSLFSMAPTARVDTAVTYNHTSICNNVCDAIDFAGALDGCVINGNTFDNSGTVTNNIGQIRSSVFSNNIIGADGGGNLALGGGMLDGGELIGNSIQGTLSTGASITVSTISNNYVLSALSTAETVQAVIFSDNRFVSDVTFTGTVAAANFVGNIVNSLTFSGSSTLDDVIISENRMSSALSITGTSQTNTVISNNSVDTTLVLSAATQTVVVVSGNQLDALTIGVAVTDLNLTGNIVEGLATFTGALTDANIIGNNILSTTAFQAALSRVHISSNIFNILTFPGTDGSDIVLTNNHMTGAFSCTSGGVYTRTNISDNTIDDTFTFSSVLSSSIMSDNTISLAVLFNGTAELNTGLLVSTVIDGNVFGAAASFTATTGAGTEATMLDSVLSNNSISGTLTISMTADRVMLQSSISSNSLSSLVLTNASATLNTVETSSISDNVISGAFTVANTNAAGHNFLNSLVSGNRCGSWTAGAASTTGKVFEQSSITGNQSDGSFIFGNGGRSVSSIAYLNTSFDGNVTNSFSFRGQLSDSVLSANNVRGTFSVGNLLRTNVVSNTFGTAATAVAIDDSVLSNNLFESTFVVSGEFNRTRVSNNHFASTLTTDRFTGCTISGNVLIGAFNTDLWLETTCANNMFNSSFTLSSTVDPIELVVFSNNVCKAAVLFEKTTAGGTDNFKDSSFTGNVIDVSLTIGGTQINEFTYLTFTGNSGAGSLTLDTSTTAGNLDGIVIVGNTMHGGLTLSDGTFTLPTTTYGGLGAEGVVIVALNTFDTYTNITFTNDAIGWGNTSTGTAVVRGSNY